MDVERQASFWSLGSEDDFEAAQCLLAHGHWRQALFFAHLAMEKQLKCHVTRETGDVPPRTHNLVRLAGIAAVSLDTDRESFLREFAVYQLQGRYPDAEQISLDTDTARQEMARAREVLEWLKER